MNNHTPGPWSTNDLGSHIGIAPRPSKRPQHFVAYVDKESHGATCEANARLIAAAPELLEALENLADCPGLTWLNGYKLELDETMQQARSAISKAKGG